MKASLRKPAGRIELTYTIPKKIVYRGETYKYFGKFNTKLQAEQAGAKKKRKVVVGAIFEDSRTRYVAWQRKI